MSQTKLMKYTFHKPNGKPFHAYLKNPSSTFPILKQEIKISLFELHDQEYVELRFYWIDDDQDEIDLNVQNDYDVFLLKRPHNQHLHVGPIINNDETPVTTSHSVQVECTSTDEVKTEVQQPTHNRVECDSCLVCPIVGFRYKCLQCPNYDLCGQCEVKNKHSDHMMIRLPTPTTNLDVLATMSGRSSGRHRKLKCHSMPGIATIIENNLKDQPAEHGRERHHHRRKNREMQSNFFTHLYNIMRELAEGGVQNRNTEEEGSKSPEKTSTHTEEKKDQTEQKVEDKKDQCEDKVGGEISRDNQASISSNVPSDKPQELPPFPKMNENEDAMVYAERVKAYTALMGKGIEDMVKATEAVKIAAEAAKAKNAKSSTDTDQQNTVKSNRPDLVENVLNEYDIKIDNFRDVVPAPIMKTGIEILQNVSEIFSRLVNPMENMETPERKVSISSQTSSYAQTQEEQFDIPNVSEAASSSSNSIIESTPENKDKECDQLQRQPSDENDWQIIDEKSNLISSTESNKSQEEPATSSKSNDITYTDLIRQLEHEKKQQNEEKAGTSSNKTNATGGENDSTKGAIPKPSETNPEHIFHSNPMINSAINAMMAMGFSNEGAWLTQLLESVNGNIPEALDLMNAAQLNF